jgi:hypothetical protein
MTAAQAIGGRRETLTAAAHSFMKASPPPPAALDRSGLHARFSLSWAPVSVYVICRDIKMLQSSLNQLEQLVGELLERNRQLVDTNQQLSGDLARAKEENDTLQLGLMEQEELHNDATARIQALVERASAAHP